ncbi:MAG TPA: acyl-CoA dehydratase activase [Spirochaetota bacterium]|nr:acyl-CoA dehydratase activase [Spirochaetota bacterium]
MITVGINIGSTSVKVVVCNSGVVETVNIMPHEGDVPGTLTTILSQLNIPKDARAIVTGNEGRFLLHLPRVIESVCIEEALKHSDYRPDAIVSMGGEDLVVYTVDEHKKIKNNFSGNKCAAGTGEFFKQQLARMNMKLADIHSIPHESKVLRLSTRCSVFMKSDCTHRLNKGEATKGDIILSLSNVMAVKVVDFLKKARIHNGTVIITGGITRNPYIVQFIKEKLPDIDFIIPDTAAYFEAYGAALLAQQYGEPIGDTLFEKHTISFPRFNSLKTALNNVTYIPSKRGVAKPGGEYILGVDGGSTTTKACLVDIHTHEIVAAHYGRTHGDPVKALKQCIEEIQKQLKDQIGDNPITISLAATTGSSREILGVFLETSAIYNEIIAHSVGTTYFKPDIDTIFEIGGQDAKYVYLKNGVPIDYAMNEACSAGTGSFLEESAQGDLNIAHAWEIGDIALQAEQPLKFGEHCSAFINSDIRKAIQQGASREDITAGLITSIVANYLNRVVGNRTIGNSIVLQGGVAKNKAVPLAFAMLLGKHITVPPDPELMGCFGVAIVALNKLHDGLLQKKFYSLDAILNTDIVYEREFTCKACDNYCPIRVLNVNGNRYMFGGRCNKYANMRKKRVIHEEEVVDFIEKRNELLFHECAPQEMPHNASITVGVPLCFSAYTLWPLYSWFFKELGVAIVTSDAISEEGKAKVESAYCFPAEIAHGAVKNIFDKHVDYIFLPHSKEMKSYQNDARATFCPITQGLPYYIEKAFDEIPKEKILSPVISFKLSDTITEDSFVNVAVKLGFSSEEGKRAFRLALQKQHEYFVKARKLGEEALEFARKLNKPAIALLGRPYNAFTKDANMGIPKKYTSIGYTVIPFDILPFEDEEIFPNMYWFYGQLDMKASVMLAKENNIYVTFISNFSCAPDSFMLHYLKWIMGSKPFLILELDSHTADAGIDTRIEAFLDIIEGYRQKCMGEETQRYDNGLRFVIEDNELYVRNIVTNSKIPVRNNKKVTLLLASMGRLGAELLAASLRSAGINAEAMPVPDAKTLQLARQFVSGKECLPSHLVLGSALQYFASPRYKKDEIYLLFVPTTQGPCRTGQYFVFYENLFKDMRFDNVCVVTLDSSHSYTELGPHFSKHAWWGVVISDYMKDIETSLRACAKDPVSAMALYDQLWQELISVAEKDVTRVIPVLKKIAQTISNIPLQRTIAQCPKVLIVGEIYVRRDDFAVDELVKHFSKKGIIAKVSGVSEWIYYCDFIREYEYKKAIKLAPWYKKLFIPEVWSLLRFFIEQWYKHRVEKKVKQALQRTQLIPDTPHDMHHIMDMSQKHFVDLELQSEITVSSGVAATAMQDGYSGIVNISPFACLIGRVIEGILTPWARIQGYPVMSVEIDGNALPPTTLNKLEIFMLNVMRFKEKPEMKEVVEHPAQTAVAIDRKIIKDL